MQLMPGLDPGIHALRDNSNTVDCIVERPLVEGGRRRALRSWIGFINRGHLGPAGVTV
jgi:hypothetical protein